jgi:hypothetical protein
LRAASCDRAACAASRSSTATWRSCWVVSTGWVVSICIQLVSTSAGSGGCCRCILNSSTAL